MKKLIVTSCMTDIGHKYGTVTIPLMQAYARKCGADFHVNYIPDPLYSYLGYQKWAYTKLLNSYDRIMHVDIDMVIRSTTPNLFDLGPSDTFLAVDELPYQNLANECPPIDRVADMGNIGKTKDLFYINAGMYIFSRNTWRVFEEVKDDPAHYFREQTQINISLNKHFSKQTYLTFPQFNFMKIMEDAGVKKDAAYIIHYAGGWGGLTPDQVVELMKKDIR